MTSSPLLCRASSESCAFLLSSFSSSETHQNSLADIAPSSSSSIPIFEQDPAISALPASAFLTTEPSSSLEGIIPLDLIATISAPPEQVVDVGGAAAPAVSMAAGDEAQLSILQDQQLSTPTMHPNLVSTLKSIICPLSASAQAGAQQQQQAQEHALDMVQEASPFFTAPSSNAAIPQLQMLFTCSKSAASSPTIAVEKNVQAASEQKQPQQAAIVPIHLIQNRRPYRCTHTGCNKTFKNPQTLKMHHKTHCSSNGGNDSSDSSKGKVLHSLATFPQSCKAGLNKKIPSRCPVCERAFVGLYELRRHFGRKHSEGEKAHACSKCGKRFYIEVDLRDHQKLCGEPLLCKCGMKFAFKCNLVAHKKTHPLCQDEQDQQAFHHGFQGQPSILTPRSSPTDAASIRARAGSSKSFFLPSNTGVASTVSAGAEVSMASTRSQNAGRLFPSATTSSHIYRPVVKSEQATYNPWLASAALRVSRAL